MKHDDHASIPESKAPPAALPVAPAGEDGAAPFFAGIDWCAFWTAFAAALAVYVATLAPTVTLEDSGELATAAAYLGVPHPPGYPIWTIIAWFFTRVFWFVRYHGHPNPAWSIGLASAGFGALAAAVTAMLICRSGRDMLRGMKGATGALDQKTKSLLGWAGGVGGSLTFAFSPVIWSQSVIVEVYSLNAFFLVLILLLAYMWMRRPDNRLLYVTGLVFGLGMTNYQVLVLLIASLAVVVLVKDLPLFRDFFITAMPYLIVIGLIRSGLLPPIVHPTHITCYVYLLLNAVALLLAFFFLPNGKAAALTIICVEAGLAFYAYMPIASEFNPPMNWGYSRTWEGFKHAVTRGQYERIVPTDIFSARFIQVIGYYLSDLRATFTLPVAVLGLLPLTVWRLRVTESRFRAVFASIAMALAAVLLVLAEEFIMPAGRELPALSSTYLYLISGILVLLIVGGFVLVFEEVREMAARLTGRIPTPLSERATVGLVLAAGAGAVVLYAARMALKLIGSGPIAGISSILALIAAPVVLAALILWLMLGRSRLELELDRDSRKWLIATLSGFLTMSVLLIVLADPKGDLQDAFIQRVKFISSHALYGLWIGYGIVLGLAVAVTLTRGRPAVKWLGIAGALLLPAVPILENAWNPELIRTVGGAEQNGHDFGWQFGNYALRGAAAIREELAPGEAPLPNPDYPPAMEKGAIFFGGTDPGRFVPTYMIYAAKVRPDVCLITQNALADNTYMSVVRDLYGDGIWIPSTRDSVAAFQKYVDDVNAGRMAANAEIVVKDNRVNVMGAEGVMVINGILTQMIFEHDKARHAFYVEESFAIPWMYPYLAPHGLIMKLCPGRSPSLPPETIKNDMDFWAWYTKRLASNPKFRRDLAAQKAFSKLRSAIGGIYVARNLYDRAEQAFQEAVRLCPLSPEANSRLADLYVRWGRPDDAIKVMESFIREDPGNTRAVAFLAGIRDRYNLIRRRGELEAELAKDRPGNIGQALELVDVYRKLDDEQRFMALATHLLNNSNMPAPVFARLAQQFAASKEHEPTYLALQRYLERAPQDANVWVDFAAIGLLVKKPVESLKALEHARQIGGAETAAALKTDKRFDAVRDVPGFKELLDGRETAPAQGPGR